jgi:enoyl-CoA hydratase
MEMMLTGDAIAGTKAADYDVANKAFPLDNLEDEVLNIAERVAKVPTDAQQMNKGAVDRRMVLVGVRAAIRSGTEIQALAFHRESTRGHFKELAAGLTGALSKRDVDCGDYRTKEIH